MLGNRPAQAARLHLDLAGLEWYAKGMNFLKALATARAVLGRLTDLLLKGRQAGLWSEKNTPKGK